MSYSFTEKKRLRKSFAKRESVQEIPYLLAMQLESGAKLDEDGRTSLLGVMREAIEHAFPTPHTEAGR